MHDGPETQAYCRVLWGGFACKRGTPVKVFEDRPALSESLELHRGDVQSKIKETHRLRALMYSGTSLTRTRTPLGPYRRLLPRVLRGPHGGGRVLMSEVPL